MKFRIRERVNNSGYRWFYVQQRKGLWWGLPSSSDLRQICFGCYGAKLTYKEFKTLDEARAALERTKETTPYIKTVYKE